MASGQGAWRVKGGLPRVAILGLIPLFLATGLLCGPAYVERFGQVVRVPEGVQPWRPGSGAEGAPGEDATRRPADRWWAADGRWRPYRMLDRIDRLELRFSPYPEPDPDRSDGTMAGRVPFLFVPHPKWQPVAPAGTPRGTVESHVWSCPFPAPWVLETIETGAYRLGDKVEVWVGREPYRLAQGKAPAYLEPGDVRCDPTTLYVGTEGGPPGPLRFLSPLLEASPVPPPAFWKEPDHLPMVRVWIGDQQHPALYLPPPGRVVDRVEVPPGAELHVRLGVIDPFPESPGDGVAFDAFFMADEGGGARELFHQTIDPATPDGKRWRTVEVDLGDLAGRSGALTFVTRTVSVNRLYHAFLADIAIVPRHAPPAPPPHNVIVLLLDTLRPDQLEAYGGPVPTPNLNRLVRGDRCRYQALSTSSWTLTAVASLFSGLYPSAVGLPDAVPGSVVALDVRPNTPTFVKALHERGWYTYGFLNNPFIKPTSLLEGFDRVDFVVDAPAGEVVERAVEALDAAADRWPFVAYLHFMDTHLPYREYVWQEQGGETVVTSRPTEFTERSAVLSWPLTDEIQQRAWSLYRGEIRYLDHELGKLNRWLASRGLEDKTIVVVASDHGEGFWEHGLFEHGEAQTPEVNDVALFICPEGGSQGISGEATSSLPVSLLDVSPTVLGMLGIPPSSPCQGEDLSSPTGQVRVRHRVRVCEGVLYGPPEHAVVAGGFKLVEEEGRAPVLYDLARDPGEYHDVAGAHASVVADLSRAYQAHREAAGRIRARLEGAKSGVAGGGGKIDAITREQLRALGYLR